MSNWFFWALAGRNADSATFSHGPVIIAFISNGGQWQTSSTLKTASSPTNGPAPTSGAPAAASAWAGSCLALNINN